jgi:hypothetical protein
MDKEIDLDKEPDIDTRNPGKEGSFLSLTLTLPVHVCGSRFGVLIEITVHRS